MAYATPLDLLQRYTADELALRTDKSCPRRVTGDLLQAAATGGDLSAWPPEDIAAANGCVALIELAIEDAASEIDAYLASRYTVPIVPTPPVIRRFTCDLARYNLYDDQVTEVVQRRHDDILKALRDIADGTSSLADADGQSPTPPGGRVELVSGGRIFGRRGCRA
jgi:phage gp36-like protein